MAMQAANFSLSVECHQEGGGEARQGERLKVKVQVQLVPGSLSERTPGPPASQLDRDARVSH